ncbi:hypothetical protein RCG24_06875 [Neobacillus sp. OS1-32]|jgi:hypothetical protein|uniref:Uncharacterized protein n=1 Tax=Neobacillus paridis TaxID=2803862 RepID=A0ABS1TRK5_9BACI|nr:MULTISPECIES: hypothetical protein [Neobacillus]MBL4952901.1 hypothetical protein [Neobacillus paridis]WML31577.1 hypothetical protein RCG24_06875 [Neobacillus sp. OS1-32]
MWYWISMIALAMILLAVLEELVYYFWNRYLYGKKQTGKIGWILRSLTRLSKLEKSRLEETKETITNETDSP